MVKRSNKRVVKRVGIYDLLIDKIGESTARGCSNAEAKGASDFKNNEVIFPRVHGAFTVHILLSDQ